MSPRKSKTELLIQKILATPPHQLPAIVHLQGTYSIDVRYLGRSHYHIDTELDNTLESYWHFVSQANHSEIRHPEALQNLPVRQGTAIYPLREN